MTEPRRAVMTDAELAAAVRDLGGHLAWPNARPEVGRPDVAARVRARITTAGVAPSATSPTPGTRRRPTWRPARRAVVLALAAVLLLAAVAAAVVVGVPGIRLIFGPAPVTPPASLAPSASIPAGPPGVRLGLGRRVPLEDVASEVPFVVRLPADDAIGPPDAAWVSPRDEVTLTWGPIDGAAGTLEPGVGLLLTAFRGTVEPNAISKIIGSGTRVERVSVGGDLAYWINGDPHLAFYETPEGEHVEETRRWVGDALIWADGDVTYRIETGLGRDAAIRIAESLDDPERSS